ncbi:MAG: translation initiation factor IF-2 [Patescibacteria group bacterium]
MRVSDLARKLGIKTEELRAKLADFGVGEKTIEIDQTKAEEIIQNWGKKNEKEESDEGLLGMVFDEEVEEEATEAEQKEAPKKTVSTDEKKEATPEKSANADQEAARARWARAKKASEKLISRKVKKMEKDKVTRLTRQQEKLEEAMSDSSKQAAAAHGEIKIADTISVRELGEKMGVSPIRIVGELLKNGVMANLNAMIDYDTAAIVCEAFNCHVARDTSAVSGKEILKGNIAKLLEDDPANLVDRPPIVAVMGHVDHGKTTLLDAIRKTNVVAGESGGITQHIGAYQVKIKDRKITFLDTPGHEAFTTMRARGARATDIAVIVVAAEEGIKPQTIEAINHARAAEVPIIIAITKIDKPGANLEKVKGELAEHDLQATDWGGKTEVVPVSALTGKGVEELLEIILLTNDVDPAKANPNRNAVGTVIESRLDKSLGPVATVLVNTGTLKTGDNFVIGPVVGKVKKMLDWNQKNVKSAEPGMPVLIAGLGELPHTGVGEILQVLPDGETAKKKALEMQKILDTAAREKAGGMSQIIGRINSGNLKELKIVLKADVEGSLEAISENIAKIGNENVKAKIIHSGVGQVSETDVLMASAADGFLIAFHVPISPSAAKLADREGVTIRQHTIIYKLLEEIEKMLNGLLDPEEIETTLGELEVRGIFFTKGKEQTVGGMVKSGIMQRNAKIRILRDGQLIDEGKIVGLKREKDDAKEVKEGFECGLKVQIAKERIKEGDIVEAWTIEKKERKL